MKTADEILRMVVPSFINPETIPVSAARKAIEIALAEPREDTTVSADEVKPRPKIKDFFGENATLQQVIYTYKSQPELFNYAQALDWYIDELEKNKI